MENSVLKQTKKRNLFTLLLLPFAAGCAKPAQADAVDARQRRFNGIGLVLVVDAVADAAMEQVVIYDDRGLEIYGRGKVSRSNRAIMALGGSRVPLIVHAVWRKGSGWDEARKTWNEGIIVGNYTIPVAERIPDSVLADIRAHGGGLRLKFRLKPDGVLFGWDIERAAPLGDVSIFEMPGGDFLETRY